MNVFSRLILKTSPRAAKRAARGTVFLEFDSAAGADGNLLVTHPDGTSRPFGGNARSGTPVAAVKEVLTLTNDGTNVTNGDTVTVYGKTYTFQTTLTNVNGNVKRGASNTASMTNLFNAINATGGVAGTDYALAMTANPHGIATNPSGTTVVVTASEGGAKATPPSEASSHLSWAVTTVGVDGTAASKGDMLFDGTLFYFASADLTTASLTGWRKITHSAL